MTDGTQEASVAGALLNNSHLQEAQAAKQHTQGYNLDRRHAFKVNMFDEFDKFLKISDSYEQPDSKEYAPTENLQVDCMPFKSLQSKAAIAVVFKFCNAPLIRSIWQGV